MKIMNNIHKILIAFCALSALILGSCGNNDVDWSQTKAPEITLILDSVQPDLNKTDNIPVLCVVFSEAGLRSVKMSLVKNGEEIPYKEVSAFYDPKQYSVKELPQWEMGIDAFRIVASDVAGRSTEAQLPVTVIEYKLPPVISFELPEIVIDETTGTTEIPLTKFEVRGATVLSSMEITLFRKTGPEPVTPNPSFVIDRDSIYRFEQDILYQDGDIALQVKATDKYGKSKIETLPIKYIPVPAPELTATGATSLETIVANSGSNRTLTFHASSTIGITAIRVYKLEKDAETELTAVSQYYNSEKEVDFTAVLPAFEATWNAVRIKAYDQLGRSTSIDIQTIIDLRYAENVRIGSQYYSKTADPEYPDSYCFFSVKDLKTYPLQYFFNNKSNIDLTFYIFLGAPDIRIYSPTVNRNDGYCAGWSTDVDNGIPAMLDGEAAWNGKNNTKTVQYMKGSYAFDFDNATADDLAALRDGSLFDSGGGTIAGLKTGDVVIFKTAASSTAPSTVGLLRIESFTYDDAVKWKGYYIVSFKTL
jgi:hypothetical protein